MTKKKIHSNEETNLNMANETEAEGASQSVTFPIVGIGASAGGLAAFKEFFSGMPKDVDTNMAFILVQHLAPDHTSILTDLIRNFTQMQVFKIEDGMKVQPNCVYIIQPNFDLALLNGKLQLFETAKSHELHLPIDFFFHSLAQDLNERAICVILSGTGSDGSLGLRAVKDAGGLVLVQKIDSTEFNGMPRSAVDTGLVDFELAPAEMPAQIISYVKHTFDKPALSGNKLPPFVENSLKKIFILVRNQTGHDFSQYKPSTINRRIERRMALNQINAVDEYVKFLQQTPGEITNLFHDMLIGVTGFFRDQEAFLSLTELAIPRLFVGKASNSLIRIWVPACSTGEEAYSIAILIQEYLELNHEGYKIQIFATDIDSQSITKARIGKYPASIAAGISAERLNRFFSLSEDGTTYRINKNIRDMVIFSDQDVIKDPPFSKLDLISCRNLMIYMNSELQDKLIPLFHYSLNPEGLLLLGTSESIGNNSNLFSAINRKTKLYMRNDYSSDSQREILSQFVVSANSSGIKSKDISQQPLTTAKLPLRELTEQAILQNIVPVAALVNRRGDILYLHGRTGDYFELAPGEASVNNVIKMAREGLQQEITRALHKAIEEKQRVDFSNIEFKTTSGTLVVDLTICPVNQTSDSVISDTLFLLTLSEANKPELKEYALPLDPNASFEALKAELRSKEEYLQSTNEELETANEELKSSYEEMQSVNEELQSTNEELETAKEELQSINEELITVNSELQDKVTELTRTNNDMNNLIAGTGIGTVFVDNQMKILRFTPNATSIINLINGDVGRSVGHIVSNLVNYEGLTKDVQTVLDTLIPKEMEVQTTQGVWYTMRIQPYRTSNNMIEGAVITFVDITEAKMAREALRQDEETRRLAIAARDSKDAYIVQDLLGRILAWNLSAERLYGWSTAEALKMNIRDLIPEEQLKLEKNKLNISDNLTDKGSYPSKRNTKDGRTLNVMVFASRLIDETGQVYGFTTTEQVDES
jgi:two-component system CheB/CheR fusion protein